MFSLIITIISIALVAILALATLYYGGRAFLAGSAEAKASEVINTAQQISGASALYMTETGAPVAKLSDLPPSYLKVIPDVSSKKWDMLAVGSNTLVLPYALNLSACQMFNKKMLKTTAVPAAPILTQALGTYCFGSESTGYSVLWKTSDSPDTVSTVSSLNAAVSAKTLASGQALTLAESFTPVAGSSVTLTATGTASNVFTDAPLASAGGSTPVTPPVTTNYANIDHVSLDSGNYVRLHLNFTPEGMGKTVTFHGKVTDMGGGPLGAGITATAYFESLGESYPTTMSYNEATGQFTATVVFDGPQPSGRFYIGIGQCSPFEAKVTLEDETITTSTYGCY